MEFVISAVSITVRVCHRLILFPFTGVVFPIIRFFYGLVNHLLLIPIFLIFRTFIYGFIYIPLLPVLKVTEIHFDTLVPVELTLYRLAVGLLPHLHVFLYHSIHYFMVSMFVGTFVGMVAGFNISIVSRILCIGETKNESAVKRFGEAPVNAPEWKRVKRDPHSVVETSEISPKKQSPERPKHKNILEEVPKVKTEPNFMFSPTRESAELNGNAIFEDDDGYSFMTYKVSDDRRKHRKKDGFKKRRDNRYRSVPPRLQMTIEEESESETIPAPMHSTTAGIPIKHVSLAYATGTIGSSKTSSTDSSVFSKTLGQMSSETKEIALLDSPAGASDMSVAGADCKDKDDSGPKQDGYTRDILTSVHGPADADAPTADKVSAKEERSVSDAK
ncbi:hypothetical protein METBIDRAFT_190545 [Metschnikowia bicuspidata var. bicuspidata NRRL YB-4993]|uniref:Uncharacterized protein n=1 Tax=Metschnikowia bicuspidata var. bicuspidata NRRL YB-4993 TaxID=869754 RepID=A0A1A0HCF0_9ASCO|nr:hypothetical protein METBIDRAFT_190545 [Metschnikowia bicuspidata var. bicuspidata NRRL YB-4993]OBA21671.1 hypothetical protein METBIDRAFT_190545 [Metschnikowia bicuspidata var. bicuspidata NRRL YB-4993]